MPVKKNKKPKGKTKLEITIIYQYRTTKNEGKKNKGKKKKGNQLVHTQNWRVGGGVTLKSPHTHLQHYT